MRWRAAALLVLCAAGAAHAEDYWAYRTKDLDVMASGSKAYALSIAQRVNALDDALMTIFGEQGSLSHVPTHIYVLPAAELAELNPQWSDHSGAYFSAGPLEAVLVMQSENEGPARLDDVYRQRALSWLTEHGLARMPDWFLNGYAQIVAAASVDNDHLLLGQSLPDKMAELAKVRWYRIDQVLRQPSNDPIFNGSPADRAFYDAECWWLAHLVMFDGSLGDTMVDYLKQLRQGASQDLAYARSFKVAYDTLDEQLRKLRRNLKPKTVSVDLVALPEDVEPRPLEETAVRARLAELAVMSGDYSERSGQRIATALTRAPSDERAQLAHLHYSVATRKYDKIGDSLQPLLARDDLDDYAARTLAVQLVALANQRASGIPGLQAYDNGQLHTHARRLLTRAMDLNAADPVSRFELGRLYASEGDLAAIRELLPAVEKACMDRPFNADLANLLMKLYALDGNAEKQFAYALRTYELSGSSLLRKQALQRARRLEPIVKPAADATKKAAKTP